MAMATRRRRERQEEFWYRGALAEAPGHLFYTKLSEVLEKASFDQFCEGRCRRSITRDSGVRRWHRGCISV